jgi:hypothetical protein
LGYRDRSDPDFLRASKGEVKMSAGSVATAIGSASAAGFAAGGPIGAGIAGATAAIQQGIQQLALHTARLKNATNENEALDQVIPAFDADLLAIQNAFNTGTSAQDCIQALELVDTNIYTYLRSLVGKPGTAWGGPTDAEIGPGVNPTYSAPCNKSCTASCCVYLNDLRPAIYGRAGVNFGIISAILAGGGKVAVPEVYPPSDKSYGDYSRASYALVFTPPPTSFAAQALQVSGVNVVTVPPNSPTTAPASGLLAALTSTEIVAILGVLGGLILIITALFGQNALRVNR